MKNRAQSSLEYVILIAIISAALFAMQLYFKRAVQATVKLAADQVGSQKKGSEDVDYKYIWKVKGQSDITSSTSETSTSRRESEGVVIYEKDNTSIQEGVLSRNIQTERD